jgi:hypothetical protein
LQQHHHTFHWCGSLIYKLANNTKYLDNCLKVCDMYSGSSVPMKKSAFHPFFPQEMVSFHRTTYYIQHTILEDHKPIIHHHENLKPHCASHSNVHVQWHDIPLFWTAMNKAQTHPTEHNECTQNHHTSHWQPHYSPFSNHSSEATT